MASHSDAIDTSSLTPRPAGLRLDATFDAAERFTSAQTTMAPSWASLRAIPSPMPRPAPVTIATLPVSKSPDSNATRPERNADVTAQRRVPARNRHRNGAPLG